MDTQKRMLLFTFICIPTRIALAFAAKSVLPKYSKIVSIIAIFIAIAWIYKYFTHDSKTSRGAYGGKVWWNKMRIVHAVIFIIFAILVIQKNPNAWLLLLFDVVIGSIATLALV